MSDIETETEDVEEAPAAGLREMIAAARANGLTTINQFDSLVLLVEQEPMKAVELGRLIGVQLGGMTTYCNKLADKGILEWVPAGNRRVFLVTASVDGRAMYERICQGLGPEEVEAEEKEAE